jgi:hypothetical protein
VADIARGRDLYDLFGLKRKNGVKPAYLKNKPTLRIRKRT